MSRKRTKQVFAIIFAFVAAPALAHETPVDAFADCAGRYSAEMEHAWLLDASDADEFQQKRATFVALLDASMPARSGRMILDRRIQAKFAHAQLLQQADLGQDRTRAQSARLIAYRHLAACQKLLLGS
ncbi:MAG: hypothetical protein AB3N17_17305 [Tateyamaria sp.]